MIQLYLLKESFFILFKILLFKCLHNKNMPIGLLQNLEKNLKGQNRDQIKAMEKKVTQKQ